MGLFPYGINSDDYSFGPPLAFVSLIIWVPVTIGWIVACVGWAAGKRGPPRFINIGQFFGGRRTVGEYLTGFGACIFIFGTFSFYLYILSKLAARPDLVVTLVECLAFGAACSIVVMGITALLIGGGIGRWREGVRAAKPPRRTRA
jgi:hypothetical protein